MNYVLGMSPTIYSFVPQFCLSSDQQNMTKIEAIVYHKEQPKT